MIFTPPLIARVKLLTAASLALLLASHSAHAQIDCWIDAEHPKTADLKMVNDPSVAPLRQTLREFNKLLHARPELHALPRTRLRSSWQIGGQWTAPARPAHFLLRDHRESVWVKGRCDVVAGADRIGPLLSVVASVNAPHAFFESEVPELKDDRLAAWRALPVTGTLRGRPIFGGHMLVFTSNGKLPWVPVTTAEYLDFTQRDLQRKLEDVRKDEESAPSGEQDRMLDRIAEGLRRTDPANADRLIAEIRVQHARANAGVAASEARRRNQLGIDNSPVETMLRRVRTWRAGLTGDQLKAQARLGFNGLHPADVPPDRFPLLAKPDPSFPWDRANPTRAQMIKLEVRGGDRFEQPMQRVMEGLDLDAIDALVVAR